MQRNPFQNIEDVFERMGPTSSAPASVSAAKSLPHRSTSWSGMAILS